MYCGDETGAFIGDIGSHTARFGYGGEDCPKVVVPSAAYEHYPDNGNNDEKRSNHKSGRFSAPVSLMKLPPEDCFLYEGGSSSTPTSDGGDVGFIPIYQSLNSNNYQHNNSSEVADDGMIQDMEAWACLWEHSYEALCVRGKNKHTLGHKNPLSETSTKISTKDSLGVPIDHPLLAVDSTSRIIETSFSEAKSREKQRSLMLETLFESLSAPAAYLAPSAMLSCFAYGRQTALVVDVGHTGIRATPIVDGHVLKYGSVRSGRGGRWLGCVQKSVLEGLWEYGNGDDTINKWNGWTSGSAGATPPCQENGVLPRYLLHSQLRHGDSNEERKLRLLKQSSFHSMTVHEAMYEMITSPHVISLDSEESSGGGTPVIPFCGYGDGQINDETDNIMDVDKNDEEDGDNVGNGDDGTEALKERSQYELPDGTVIDLKKSRAGRDLCRLPELLFSEELPAFIQPPTIDKSKHYNEMLPVHHLIYQSLHKILDADVRKELCTSILLTGASSLVPGMDKRISHELGEILPSTYKCKVIASKYDVERKYGAWIGGSILSSLGSFQQLWLSRKEYEEYGSVLGLQRFK